MKQVLGIDVAKAKVDLALRPPNGKWPNRQVDNSPAGFVALSAWLAKLGVVDLHVCMEATGSVPPTGSGQVWEAVAEFLVEAGHRVSVVNPAQIKDFGQASLVRTKLALSLSEGRIRSTPV